MNQVIHNLICGRLGFVVTQLLIVGQIVDIGPAVDIGAEALQGTSLHRKLVFSTPVNEDAEIILDVISVCL